MSDGGKGSARRPCDVPDEVVSNAWENIFGKKKEEVKEDEESETSYLNQESK